MQLLHGAIITYRIIISIQGIFNFSNGLIPCTSIVIIFKSFLNFINHIWFLHFCGTSNFVFLSFVFCVKVKDTNMQLLHGDVTTLYPLSFSFNNHIGVHNFVEFLGSAIIII